MEKCFTCNMETEHPIEVIDTDGEKIFFCSETCQEEAVGSGRENRQTVPVFDEGSYEEASLPDDKRNG